VDAGVPLRYPLPVANAPHFPSDVQRTLDALLQRLAPPPVPADLAPRALARITRLPPHQQRDLHRALRLLGAPATSALGGGGWRAFHRLPDARQDDLIRRWLSSRFLAVRMAINAIRRLALATAVADRAGQARIGAPRPSHQRPPQFAWEGAAPGDTTIDEPIARGSARPAPRELPAAAFIAADRASGARLTADAVVIGSGAGGAIAAARLAAAGLEVLIVESGDDVPTSALTEHDADMMERLYADGATRTTDDLSIPLLQGAAVGGGTIVNWMMALRTPTHVLDEWHRDAGTSGMSAADLRPIFDRLEGELRVRPVPDDAHSANNQRLRAGASALGWRHTAAPINADHCLRAGTCGLGCIHGAKQDARQVHLAQAVAHGARILARATAERITTTERAGAFPRKRVTVALRDGGDCTIDAPIVVCAGGAVGTPVLLQRSGLGGDRVGDFLRLHPTTAVLGVYDHDIHAGTGIPLSVMCDEFVTSDRDGYGFWIECPPLQPILAALAIPRFGAQASEWLSHYPRFGAFIALVRDGAERDRSDGSVRVHRDGRPRIRYTLAPRDAAHLQAAMRAAGRLHLAAGASEVRTLHRDPIIARDERALAAIDERPLRPHDLAIFSAHVNGTCRIAADRRRGGCTPDGERWGANGVFVVDGSLLPTAPGVNPQLTIMALADVVAGRIASRYRRH
jgi:choline dehydrogenase-like flavoprotein